MSILSRRCKVLAAIAAIVIAAGSLETVAVATAFPIGERTELRVVSPEERRAFYRTAGKEAVGRPIHLHVEGEVLRRAPEEFVDVAGSRWIRFEQRDVPLVIPAKSPYWLQVRRHLGSAGEFCVHGRVRLIPGDERQRAGVEVTKIVRAPGSWR
ncbi:MAG: hypothetical protein EXS13_05625 [Planctomycetes bacterium]|nr:hypothetical protein [Planctomycetota bacterium]